MINLIPILFTLLLIATLGVVYLYLDSRRSRLMASFALDSEPTSRLSMMEIDPKTANTEPTFTELTMQNGRFVRKEATT